MIDAISRALLEDRLSYSREAIDFLSTRDVSDIAADRMRQLAIIRAVEVVGEAASKVAPPTRAALPSLPWRAMIGMRNLLIHGYGQIRLDLLVETVRRDLPALCVELERLLGADPA